MSVTQAPQKDGRKKAKLSERLYVGNGAFDVVGRRKRWYFAFGLFMLVCIASMVFRGFNLGIDFNGGTRISLPAQSGASTISVEQVTRVFDDTLGKEPAAVQTVGAGASQTVQIKSDTLNAGEVGRLKAALAEQVRPNGGAQAISDSAVSASWGGEISQKALWALLVFLVAVTIFLVLYFEFWMAVTALIALLHDVVATAGVYSLIGLEVTPATVIGLLTILGFSLYDTVVVFDKVKENTRGLLGLTRRTYAEAANLALNQTLMRSINTSLIALLPVIGLLIIGVGLLGVGTLGDLALVQLTGIMAGALSSICLATPMLVDFKMTDPKFRQQAQRVFARRETLARRSAATTAGVDPSESTDDADIDTEVRQERAMAAMSGVPARNLKASDAKRKPASRPTGKKRT